MTTWCQRLSFTFPNTNLAFPLTKTLIIPVVLNSTKKWLVLAGEAELMIVPLPDERLTQKLKANYATLLIRLGYKYTQSLVKSKAYSNEQNP